MSQLTVFLLVLLQACLVFAKDNTWKVPVGVFPADNESLA